MTYLQKQSLLAYRAERRRRRWNDDRLFGWTFAACTWLCVYLMALKYFGVI